MSTMTLIEQEQTELNRLMATVERLQRAGYDERQITAAVGATGRRRRLAWRSRLRVRGGAPSGA